MAWENTSSFFIRSVVKDQRWVNIDGEPCKGRGLEFSHENEFEEIHFFVPNHSCRRSHDRIIEHTDMILLVWEEFIKTTAYLDYVTEGDSFVIRIENKFICPMICTEMNEKRVRFHLSTAAVNDETTPSFGVKRKDIIIDCRLHAGTVEFSDNSDSVTVKQKAAI